MLVLDAVGKVVEHSPPPTVIRSCMQVGNLYDAVAVESLWQVSEIKVLVIYFHLIEA